MSEQIFVGLAPTTPEGKECKLAASVRLNPGAMRDGYAG